MANLLNSKAAGEFEQARRTYIENQMRATQTYFEMRRYNAEARQAARSTPLSMEQYVRIAREQAPDGLSPTQLDPLTGTISWPSLLRQLAYEPLRKHIEKLFHDRAAGYVVYGEIQQACQDLQAALKADVDKFPANDYITAKKFIESLTYAARGAQS